MRGSIRLTLRRFRRSPGFVLAAVLSLSLGIGANTAIFGLIQAVLLRTLPVQQPERLVLLTLSEPDRNTGSKLPIPLYHQLREPNNVLEGLAAFTGTPPMTTAVGETAERSEVLAVSSNFFATLGLPAVIGRATLPETDPESGKVCVISHGFWMRRFGGSPDALGQTLRINGQPYLVIGVTPKEFTGIDPNSRTDVTIPLRPRDGLVSLFGRLKPGVTRAQAQDALDAAYHHSQGGAARVVLQPGSSGFRALRRQYERPLLFLMAVVALLLLVACANVANLLMARAHGRSRELAVRLALGAARGELIASLLLETLLLAAAGGAVGMLLACWVDQALVALAPGRALVVDVRPDWHLFLFTLAIACLVCLAAGLLPALRATRPDLLTALKGAPALRAPGKLSLANALVVAQIALSSALLIAAGLFLRTLFNLRSVDPGFDPDHVVVLTATRQDLFDRIIERARAFPGVLSASPALISVLNGDFASARVQVPGYTRQAQPENQRLAVNWVGGDFFRTLGIQLAAGRTFSGADGITRKVALINENAAAHFWPGQSPIGKHILVDPANNADDCEIVGVVKGVRSESLRQPAPRMLYLPFDANRRAHMRLHIRVAGPVTPVIEALRKEVHALDPANVPEVVSMAAQVEQTLGADHLLAILTAGFGVLGCILAAVGLYGVMLYNVGLRTREFGIRLALGATSNRVVLQLLRESALLILLGTGLGLFAAVWASAAVESLLYGLSPTDPSTYAAVAALLALTGLAAAYVPARRAGQADPMVSLRCG